jgi:predicted acyltransferase
VQRTLILIAVGIFINRFPVFQLAHWRIEGVLQRIAVCYLIAAVLVLWSDWRGRFVVLAACLLGYWAADAIPSRAWVWSAGTRCSVYGS